MKDEHKPGGCMICQKNKPVRNKNLYVSGSEGLDVCIDCEMDIVNYIRRKQRQDFSKRLAFYKSKEELKEKNYEMQ